MWLMWDNIIDWFVRNVLRIQDLHWLERPGAFIKQMRAALGSGEESSLRNVHLQFNHSKDRVRFNGVATMTLCDGQYEFDDVVYISGMLMRGTMVFSLRCEAIYHGIIPHATYHVVLNNRVFDRAVQIAAKFKRDLDLLHIRHSRASQKR